MNFTYELDLGVSLDSAVQEYYDNLRQNGVTYEEAEEMQEACEQDLISFLAENEADLIAEKVINAIVAQYPNKQHLLGNGAKIQLLVDENSLALA